MIRSTIFIFTCSFACLFSLSCSASIAKNTNSVTAPRVVAQSKTLADNRTAVGAVKSTFDDGWTSTMESKWVRVSRNNGAIVHLHHGIKFPSDMFVIGNDQARLNYYWSRTIGNRYSVQEFGIIPSQDHEVYYGVGRVTESATGKPYIVSLTVFFRNGIGYAIEATAPDENTYNQTFSTIDATKAMLNYNRFRLTPSNLSGKWEQGSGSVQAYYDSSSGQYADSNVIRGDHSFVFNRNGSYKSQHNLVSGMSSSLKARVLDYQGRFSLNGWQMSMTNRFDGKTEVYESFIEATANGPVLRLILLNKSLQFTLSKQN